MSQIQTVLAKSQWHAYLNMACLVPGLLLVPKFVWCVDSSVLLLLLLTLKPPLEGSDPDEDECEGAPTKPEPLEEPDLCVLSSCLKENVRCKVSENVFV